MPASVLISVNPNTMQIIDNITLPAPAGARPTITRYHGVDYVYLLENTSNPVRYSVHNGIFTLDTSWTPAAVPYPGQTTGGSLIVMNDWILGATNSHSCYRGADGVRHQPERCRRRSSTCSPIVNDPIPPVLAHAFATARRRRAGDQLGRHVVGGRPRERPVLRRGDAGPQGRRVQLTDSGIKIVWKKTQTTTEWATLIGPKDHRVWVGTDIPGAEIPGQNTDRQGGLARRGARVESSPARRGSRI